MRNREKLLLPLLFGTVSTAFAQSSVALFGIADANILYGTGSISNKTQISRGGLSANRIGLRGTEDLGKGISASFWLEAGYNIDDGLGVSSNSNNQISGATSPNAAAGQGLTFGRRSTISLSSKKWGEIRIGRDFVPQYLNQASGDPFNNLGSGAAVSYTSNITGVTSVRASNSIGYFSPVVEGISIQIMYYLGENPSDSSNKNDGNGGGARLTYTQGPLFLGAAWGRTKYFSGDAVQRNLHASYDFGFARIMATINRDQTGLVYGRGGVIAIQKSIGLNEFKLSYSKYDIGSSVYSSANKVALGYVYNFSKRTALYATYAHLKNSGGSAVALNNAITAPHTRSNGYDFGIRHIF